MQAIESAVFAVVGKDCGANGKRVNSRQAKENGGGMPAKAQRLELREVASLHSGQAAYLHDVSCLH